MPEVSVVIPAYNTGRYIDQAVESVLAQTFDDLELIVVDDGSTDDTQAVIEPFGPLVRYIYQENSGVSVARNNGVAAGTGRYVAFLDADDTWLPDKLSRQLQALGATKGNRLSHTAAFVTDPELNPIEVRRSVSDVSRAALLVEGNVVGIGSSSVVCERELFRLAGGFDPGFSQCADWDMWIRLSALTRFTYVDEPLVNYRQHGLNMSGDPRLLEDDSVRMLEKGFAMHDIEPEVAAMRRRGLARNYMVLAGTYFQAGRYKDFARCAARSVSMDPRRASYLAAFPLRVAGRRFGRAGT